MDEISPSDAQTLTATDWTLTIDHFFLSFDGFLLPPRTLSPEQENFSVTITEDSVVVRKSPYKSCLFTISLA